MTAEILVKYAHFVCVFLIVGALVGEHLLLRPSLTRAELHRLARLDGLYALGVIGVLAAGFTLWFWIGKPAAFYSDNPLFLTKLGLFGLMGVLSIYPSIFFARQRKGDPAERVTLPAAIVWLVRAELLCLFSMPLLATLMARGIGL